MKPGLNPKAFTLWTAADLLKQADPWANFRPAAASLKPGLKQMGL